MLPAPLSDYPDALQLSKPQHLVAEEAESLQDSHFGDDDRDHGWIRGLSVHLESGLNFSIIRLCKLIKFEVSIMYLVSPLKFSFV